MDKTTLRKDMRQLTRDLAPELRDTLSRRALSRLAALEPFAAARTVGLFMSLPDEVRTQEFVEALAAAKRVALPVVAGDDMHFEYWEPASGRRTGKFGIEEPRGGLLCPPEEMDIIVVPGVAFDMEMRRLGRGRGYYDRWLATAPATLLKAGVCYPHQLVGQLPHEPHDIAMDMVVTADRVLPGGLR